MHACISLSLSLSFANTYIYIEIEREREREREIHRVAMGDQRRGGAFSCIATIYDDIGYLDVQLVVVACPMFGARCC